MEITPGSEFSNPIREFDMPGLPDKLTWMARQEALARNFHENIGSLLGGEVEGVELRPHQPGVFQELDEFFVDTMYESGRGIMMPLPPNAGKSTMVAIVTDLAGIGKPPGMNQPPLTSLTLTPRRVARQQTHDTYRQFAPGIRALSYKGEDGLPEDQPPTDAWLLTYKAVTSMGEREWDYFCSVTDLLVLDEVHRAIGTQISARVRRIINDRKPTVVAMSATPDFSEDRSSCKVLGIKRSLNPVTPRDAVEIGISNGVQLFALYSGETVEMTSKRNTATESDLSGLVYNRKRNDLIVDVMFDRAKVGHQGIVQCIPGRGDIQGEEGQHLGSAHAREIARLACQREIIDPDTGILRHMKVKAVGNFQTDPENDELIAAFKQGEYDALTFSKLLTEAFDHPIKYLIANLTTSIVDMGQITGRGGRFHDELTGIYCIIDKYLSRTRKRLLTPFDVYGEECITQGIVMGEPRVRRKSRDKTKTSKPRSGQSLQKNRDDEEGHQSGPAFHESSAVRDALASIATGTVLDELLLVRGDYAEVPEGYIPLSSLPTIQRGLVTEQGARYALTRRTNATGNPLFISLRTGLRAQYVLPEAENVLSELYFDTSRKVTRIDLDSFLVSEGWPRPSFDAFVRASGEAGAEFTMSKKTITLEPEGAEKILRYLAAIPLVDPTSEIPLSSLAHAVGYATSSDLHRAIRANPGTFEDFLRKRRKGVPQGAYKIVETIQLEAAAELLGAAVAYSATLAKRLGSADLQKIVDETQLAIRAAMWKRKLRSHLSEASIQNFIGQFSLQNTQTKVKIETITEQAKLAETVGTTVLDESYMLSDYGEIWSEHAACTELENVNSFFSSASHHIARAKRICQICPVKGDCLLFELEHPSTEIAGGFTQEEREALSTQDLLGWFSTHGKTDSER
jgi:WhiB family redox-sensing transcriptional regulator